MKVRLDSLAAKMVRDLQKADDVNRPASEIASRAVRVLHAIARGDAALVLGEHLTELNADLDRQRDKPQ